VKPPWTINIHLKYEGQEGKEGLVKGGYQWEGGRLTERVKEGEMWLCFVFVHENRTMKLVEMVLRMGEGGWGRTMKGVNLLWYVAITSVHAIMCPSVQQLHAN
jgi:hypothetical protein